MSDLSLATVDELIVELAGRVDNLVVLAAKDLSDGESAYKTRYKGKVAYSVFLMAQAQAQLLREFDESEEPLEVWEQF